VFLAISATESHGKGPTQSEESTNKRCFKETLALGCGNPLKSTFDECVDYMDHLSNLCQAQYHNYQRHSSTDAEKKGQG